MSEIFKNQSMNRMLTLPATGSEGVNANELDWQDSGTEGFWIKPLFEQSSHGLRTWLMKVDPGAYSPMHAHEEVEQIYVAEGSFYDQDNTYGPGDFIIRAAGAMHTAGSEDGALVMLFYSPDTHVNA